MILLDSNLLIYSVQKEYSALRQWILSIQPAYSIISKVEVLGYWNLSAEQSMAINNVLKSMRELSLSSSQCEQAIYLRQIRKMSLGDALIAATALDHELALATRNNKDFDWITGLSLINPFDQ
jgi:predicted nucleic acid-binding protein